MEDLKEHPSLFLIVDSAVIWFNGVCIFLFACIRKLCRKCLRIALVFYGHIEYSLFFIFPEWSRNNAEKTVFHTSPCASFFRKDSVSLHSFEHSDNDESLKFSPKTSRFFTRKGQKIINLIRWSRCCCGCDKNQEKRSCLSPSVPSTLTSCYTLVSSSFM